MAEIISLNSYRDNSCFASAHDIDRMDCDTDGLSDADIKRLETLRDAVEDMLNTMTAVHRDPEAVAYAAGRFAAMRLFALQGRAETMAFIDQCIETAEIAEDMAKF
ncbi:MAG: hypothetical protein EBT71_02505 [Alphaproteobacteria bacterium]|jgi:hypothetical protein|nr:hypothetical protein [Alphaproteobacteria bacterium]